MHPMIVISRPTWSPDGTKIAFQLSNRNNVGKDHQEIYVMDADGNEPE